MRSVIAAVFLAGCIQPSLVECDETLCPSGTACGPLGSCVSEDQLMACLGLEEREPCELASGPGVCAMGVCQPLICGNGILTEPDEACDDGNNVGGDGCSADCQSREICGNGIVDVAAGEGCDDGGSEDGDDCHADCSLPRCGDGVLDSFEQCELGGASSEAVTCEDFGFYEGEITCSSLCRFTPEPGCTGRCGDGVLQPAFGEDCDGAPPVTSCLARGFDYGAIGCTNRCVADLVGRCGHFGWRQLAETGGSRAAGAAGSYVVWGETTFSILWSGGGVRSVFGEPAVAGDLVGDVAMHATTQVITLYHRDGTDDLLPLLGGMIVDAALAADATPFALVRTLGVCEVARFENAAWSRTQTDAACERLVVLGPTDYAVVAGSSLEWTRADGGTTVITIAGTVIGATSTATQLLVDTRAVPSNRISRRTFTVAGTLLSDQTLATFPPGALDGISVRGDRVFARWESPAGSALLAGALNHSEPMAPPSASPTGFATTRDGQLLLTAANRIYTARANVPSDRVWNEKLSGGSPSIASATDDSLVLCANQVSLANGTSHTDLRVPGFACTAMAVRSREEVFVGRSDLTSSTLYRVGASTSPVAEYTGGAVSQLAVDADQAAAVIGSTPHLRLADGTWTPVPLPAECDADKVAIANDEIVVTAGGDGCLGVYAYRGGAWVQILAGTTSHLVTARDGSLVVVQGATVRVRAAGTTTWVELPPMPSVTSIAAATPNEIAVSLRSDPHVHLWDGTAWSPIDVPKSSSMVMTTRDLMTATVTSIEGEDVAAFSAVLRGLDQD